MKQLKALIFDVDGTLAETERDGHRTAFNRAFKQAGLDWVWDVSLYGELLSITGGKERMLYYLQHSHHTPVEKRQIKRAIADIHARKTELYTRKLKSGNMALRPGVERLINEARQQGLLLAIATTSSYDNVTALLTATLGTSALDWFTVIAAGDVVSQKKPAPDIYLYCLQQMGLDAAQCLAVEDSANGLQAAQSAGLVTLVTPSFYTHKQSFEGAACVVDCLENSQQKITVETLREIHEKAHY